MGKLPFVRVNQKGRLQTQPSPATPDSDAGALPAKEWCSGWLFALFIAAATLMAYQPVWRAGFIWDDGFLVFKNVLVQQADGWWRVWCSRGIDYVPATSTTFWLEWHLWQDHALGYHLDNVLLHALGAIMVWRVLLRLQIPGARLAAAIFALHPVNVESVAWISERKNTLAMVFFACALLGYLLFEDSGKWRWYWLAAAAFVLGIFSKTAIAPLPLVLLGMAWWRRGKIGRADICRSLLFFGLAAAASVLAVWIQRNAFGSFSRTADFWTRLAGAGRAVWFYLGKAFLPLNLIPVYPLWYIDEKKAVSYLPALAVAAVLAVSWHYRARAGKAPLAAFGYFLLLLLPVLGFLDITYMHFSLVADQWQYFAILGPIALVAAGITLALRRTGPTFLQPVVCALLLMALGVLTWRQSRVYTDSSTLWQTTLAEDPGSFVALSSVGGLLFKDGQTEKAIEDYQKALALEPKFFEARQDLASIFDQTGRDAEAIAEYQKVLQLKPDYLPVCNNLAWLLATSPQASNRNGAKAVAIAQQAGQLSGGNNASVNGTLAAAYAEAGRFPEAVAAAQKALALALPQNDTSLIGDLRVQLNLYQKGLPYRKPARL
jgi:Flp pilus assembly protein TadD